MAEAVEGSGGMMVVVGLDAARAGAELDRGSRRSATPARLARQRAAGLDVSPAGAATAIVEALEAVGE